MPPKKKPAATAPERVGNILVTKTETVPVKSLKMFHKNPRIGNVEKIARSLKEFGQFRPILVNAGTYTGRPDEIAAGNHTYMGAKRLGWDSILVSVIDVDEDTLTKIVLADNRLAAEGEYDKDILAEVLKGMDDFEVTGYDQSEVDALLASTQEEVAASVASIDMDAIRNSMPASVIEEPKRKDARQQMIDEEDEGAREAALARGASRPSFEDDKDIEDVQPQPGQDLAVVQAELQAMLELKEDNFYFGDNFFQVPDLREDMLVMELPANIKTWAGHDATPDDGKTTWFYNYGLGGMKGLPLDRTILAFNTHDEKFNNWWETPAYYTAKMVVGGLRMAVVPDFSFYSSTPRFRHLEGVYRAQWIGRFLQEAGVRIIPRVQFDDKESLQFNMLGIPKNPPYLEISLQNAVEGVSKDESEKILADITQTMVNTIEPTRGFIVYGGNPARRIGERLNLHGAELIWIENYAAVRRGVVFDKKDGIAAVDGKTKKAIREKALKEEAERTGVDVEVLKQRKKSRTRVSEAAEDDE